MHDMFMVKVRRGEEKNYTGINNINGKGYDYSANETLNWLERKRKGMMEVSAPPAPTQTSGVKVIKPDKSNNQENKGVTMVAKKAKKNSDKMFSNKRTQKILKEAGFRAANEAYSRGATQEEASIEAQRAMLAISQKIKAGEMPHYDDKLAKIYRARDKALEKEEIATGNHVELFEINHYPESARRKVSDKEYLESV